MVDKTSLQGLPKLIGIYGANTQTKNILIEKLVQHLTEAGHRVEQIDPTTYIREETKQILNQVDDGETVIELADENDLNLEKARELHQLAETANKNNDSDELALTIEENLETEPDPSYWLQKLLHIPTKANILLAADLTHPYELNYINRVDGVTIRATSPNEPEEALSDPLRDELMGYQHYTILVETSSTDEAELAKEILDKLGV